MSYKKQKNYTLPQEKIDYIINNSDKKGHPNGSDKIFGMNILCEINSSQAKAKPGYTTGLKK